MLFIDLLFSSKDSQGRLAVRNIMQINYSHGRETKKFSKYAKGKGSQKSLSLKCFILSS